MKFALFAVSIIYTMIALVEASPVPQTPDASSPSVGGLPAIGGNLGGNAGGNLVGNAGGSGSGSLGGNADGGLNGYLNGDLGSAVGGLPIVGPIIFPPAPPAPAPPAGSA